MTYEFTECTIKLLKCRHSFYVWEFLDNESSTHHVELFFTAQVTDFDIKKGLDPELQEQFIAETRFLSKNEVQNTQIKVYPEVLRDRFWDDLSIGFIGHTVYLGLRV